MAAKTTRLRKIKEQQQAKREERTGEGRTLLDRFKNEEFFAELNRRNEADKAKAQGQ